MSEMLIDIDEGLWQLYKTDCQAKHVNATIKDFLIWCDEENYDRPEV